jgi:hypothetical protein
MSTTPVSAIFVTRGAPKSAKGEAVAASILPVRVSPKVFEIVALLILFLVKVQCHRFLRHLRLRVELAALIS